MLAIDVATLLLVGAHGSTGTYVNQIGPQCVRVDQFGRWIGDPVDGPLTAFMQAVPGAIAKDGAEGVHAFSLPDGRAGALKVSDGFERARPAVVVALLGHLGVAHPEVRAAAVACRITSVAVTGWVRQAACTARGRTPRWVRTQRPTTSPSSVTRLRAARTTSDAARASISTRRGVNDSSSEDGRLAKPADPASSMRASHSRRHL